MGRTMYDMARESIGYGTEYEIKGFIDDNTHALDSFPNYPPIIGTIEECKPGDDDVFVCAIGAETRRQCVETIIARGGKFLTMIHCTARILTNTQIGDGAVIGAFTTIGNDVTIGNHTLIQSYTVIGHDCNIGNFNRIDTHVTIAGGAKTEEDVCIYTSAVLNNGVVCEQGSKIAALSFVIRKVKKGTIVSGNPAREIA